MLLTEATSSASSSSFPILFPNECGTSSFLRCQMTLDVKNNPMRTYTNILNTSTDNETFIKFDTKKSSNLKVDKVISNIGKSLDECVGDIHHDGDDENLKELSFYDHNIVKSTSTKTKPIQIKNNYYSSNVYDTHANVSSISNNNLKREKILVTPNTWSCGEKTFYVNEFDMKCMGHCDSLSTKENINKDDHQCETEISADYKISCDSSDTYKQYDDDNDDEKKENGSYSSLCESKTIRSRNRILNEDETNLKTLATDDSKSKEDNVNGKSIISTLRNFNTNRKSIVVFYKFGASSISYYIDKELLKNYNFNITVTATLNFYELLSSGKAKNLSKKCANRCKDVPLEFKILGLHCRGEMLFDTTKRGFLLILNELEIYDEIIKNKTYLVVEVGENKKVEKDQNLFSNRRYYLNHFKGQSFYKYLPDSEIKGLSFALKKMFDESLQSKKYVYSINCSTKEICDYWTHNYKFGKMNFDQQLTAYKKNYTQGHMLFRDSGEEINKRYSSMKSFFYREKPRRFQSSCKDGGDDDDDDDDDVGDGDGDSDAGCGYQKRGYSDLHQKQQRYKEYQNVEVDKKQTRIFFSPIPDINTNNKCKYTEYNTTIKSINKMYERNSGDLIRNPSSSSSSSSVVANPQLENIVQGTNFAGIYIPKLNLDTLKTSDTDDSNQTPHNTARKSYSTRLHFCDGISRSFSFQKRPHVDSFSSNSTTTSPSRSSSTGKKLKKLLSSRKSNISDENEKNSERSDIEYCKEKGPQ